MATFYLNPTTGNDASNGTSWATAWKTLTTGATAARIAPGDTIRMAKSPDVVDTGRTATWKGDTSITLTQLNASSVTATTPISVTVSGHGFATGDYVMISGATPLATGLWKITVTGTSTFTLDGSSGTTAVSSGTVVRMNTTVVELDQAVTQIIENCDTAWTAVKGSVTAANGSQRQGGYVMSLNTPSSANTANSLYAYKTLAAPLDLSGYQQVSFWYAVSQTTVANNMKLCLCSDTAGTTIVHEIPIPANPASNAAGFWYPVTLDFGVPLSSSIQSVALWSGSSVPSASFGHTIDHIIASKASTDPEAITLSSLISPDGVKWFAITSIEGTRVRLDGNTQKSPMNNGRGFGGPSGSFPLYRRETTKVGPQASTTASTFALTDSGTAAAKIRLEGGWDPATTVRNGHTVLDGSNTMGIGISLANFHHWDISGLSLTRFATPVTGTASSHTGHVIDLGFVTACGAGFQANGVGCQYAVGSITNCNGGITVNGANNDATVGPIVGIGEANNQGVAAFVTGTNNRLKTGAIHNAYNGGYLANGRKLVLETPIVKDIITEGLRVHAAVSDAVIRGTTVQNSTTFDLFAGATTEVALQNCSFTTVSLTDFHDSRIFSENHGGVAGAHKIYSDGMIISTVQPAFVTRVGGWVWQAVPSHATNRLAHNPVEIRLGRIAVTSGSPVTATIQVRKSSTDAVNLGFRLVCRGGQIAGVPTDVVATAAGAVDTWEPCQIVVTPSETGVVELTALIHGSTTRTLYFTDLTIDQES